MQKLGYISASENQLYLYVDKFTIIQSRVLSIGGVKSIISHQYILLTCERL